MNKTNTVSKGDLFEKQIYDLLKKLIENEEFYVSGKRSKIFWKKGYYSESRKKDIIVDISIETYLNNSQSYSILTVVECKDYEKPVPVDDVEEFESKLRQIGEHNTKGIIFTKSGFQVSASNVAISKGLGIAIISNDNEIDWINYRRESSNQNSSSQNYNADVTIPNKNFFSFAENLSFNTLPELLIGVKIIDKYVYKPTKIKVPYKTAEQIKEVIDQLEIKKNYRYGKLITEDLCDFLSKQLDVEFTFDESLGQHNKDKILGKITTNPLKIYVTRELKLNPYRWRFTIAHEIGHLILHHEILKSHLNENIDIEKTLSLTTKDIPQESNKSMEIQANMFASILLLPEEYFLKEVARFFTEERITKGYLYLDHQPVNRNLLYNLLSQLRMKFEVSNEVAKYRLQSFNLIRGKDMFSVEEILKGTI